TTLYGAMFANMFALPIADKLTLRREEEGRVKSMIIDALLAIQSGQNPRVIDSMLKVYLPESKRAEEAWLDDEVFEPSTGGARNGGGWITTFADLMSLLMCFFVLLLSFSEMDVLKFKRLAGSMREAFGVQALV